MTGQRSKFLKLMPHSSSNTKPSQHILPESPRQILSKGIHNPAQSEPLRPLPPSEQPPIPDDAWEIWYVSLSIGRSASLQDVLAWRERQAKLESQGLQDSTDYSAWMMVKAALQEQERMNPTSEQTEEWGRSQHSRGHSPSIVPYLGSLSNTRPVSEMQERVEFSDVSAETRGNRRQQWTWESNPPAAATDESVAAGYHAPVSMLNDSRPRASVNRGNKGQSQQQFGEINRLDRLQLGLTPSHEDDSLHRRVVRREHARAASNFNVKVTSPSPAIGELADPPASAPAATTSFGDNIFKTRFATTDPSDEQRRTLSGPLAEKIGNFSVRAGQRNRDREVLPPYFQYESRKQARSIEERNKSSSTTADRCDSKTTSGPNPTIPTTYVPPNRRGGEKPWFSKNWRQT
ncbi:hypothetical protein EV356DRAFT_575782 [Viridothelium virens]|uniref:Uncharacterized protein n=1 Tax=Viridothelium virens TaxID=1048519 RepID=A0A6A6HBA8_VIRVR|nr:hypothetical protein EV356DRAFT_575782 [Viridothelium virens]